MFSIRETLHRELYALTPENYYSTPWTPFFFVLPTKSVLGGWVWGKGYQRSYTWNRYTIYDYATATEVVTLKIREAISQGETR